ncbi:hypothetical protein CULT_2360005 [[Clostridium] ultunense Esp]|nr:hypothetical protein CULT_2360005 [[Clostridium] ultunense Esp]
MRPALFLYMIRDRSKRACEGGGGIYGSMAFVYKREFLGPSHRGDWTDYRFKHREDDGKMGDRYPRVGRCFSLWCQFRWKHPGFREAGGSVYERTSGKIIDRRSEEGRVYVEQGRDVYDKIRPHHPEREDRF